MTDLLEILLLVTSRLERRGIPYMVTGSLALSLYAQPRFTRDIDLVVELHAKDVDALLADLSDGFLCNEQTMRTAVEERRLFNVIHKESITKVDFVVRKDEPFREIEFQRRRRESIGGRDVWVVSPEDLVLSKLLWVDATGSALHHRDVDLLVSGDYPLDVAYLREWSRELGVAHLLPSRLS